MNQLANQLDTPNIIQTTYIYDSPHAMWTHLLQTLSQSNNLWLQSLAFTLQILSKLAGAVVGVFSVLPNDVAGVNVRVVAFTAFLGWIAMRWIATGVRIYMQLMRIWCFVVIGLFMASFVGALLGGHVYVETGHIDRGHVLD